MYNYKYIFLQAIKLNCWFSIKSVKTMSLGKIFGLLYLSVSLVKLSSYYYNASYLSHEYCI